MTKKSQQPNGGSAVDAGDAQEGRAAQPLGGGAQADRAAPNEMEAAGGVSASVPEPLGAPDHAGAAAGTSAEYEALDAELATLREQLAEVNDKHLRQLAEFDNFKKRMRKEHEEQLKYALLPLLKDITAAIDNLERALEHARQDSGGDSNGLRAGIEMVLKQVSDIFERHGMTRIKAVGEAFDPTLHEAMMVVELGEAPENQCIQEFQAGYVLHGRVVRPAMVSVSKRPPQPPGNDGPHGQD